MILFTTPFEETVICVFTPWSLYYYSIATCYRWMIWKGFPGQPEIWFNFTIFPEAWTGLMERE